jgi:hypothetical protein
MMGDDLCHCDILASFIMSWSTSKSVLVQPCKLPAARLKALNFGLSYLGKSLDFIGLEPREFAASNPCCDSC